MTATTPEAAFAEALAAFQSEMPHIGKGQTADTGSYKYDYADLTDITVAALPVLTKNGLAWTARPTLSDAGFVLRYALLHVSGHREGGDYPLPDPARSSPQQIGSALTYGRRYCFCAVTGIAPGGEDDDGQRAADARARSHEPAPRPEPTTDLAWMDGFEKRITSAGTPAELRELWKEAAQVFAEGRLSQVDSAALKQAIDQRAAELKGADA